MRKLLLVLLFTLLCNVVYSSVSRYSTYFDMSSYMMYTCDYIVNGLIIDKRVVGYTGDDYNVVAIRVAITDKYGSNIEDTGTDQAKRSLPPSTDPNIRDVYYVQKSFKANISIAAPFYGQPGGGIQIITYDPIDKLVKDGYLLKLNR